MTSTEKALNRNDLNAYKNYDHNQYSLVTGVNHHSPYVGHGKNIIFSPKKEIALNERNIEKEKHLREASRRLNDPFPGRFSSNEFPTSVKPRYEHHSRMLVQGNEPVLPNPGNLNVGERERQMIKNQALTNAKGSRL